MSLTQIISMGGGWDPPSQEVYELINNHMITKEDFKTYTGTKAFSKDYTLKVPYNLKNSGEASLVGMAFDYLARFTIDKYQYYKGREETYKKSANKIVNKIICASTEKLCAERGLYILIDNIKNDSELQEIVLGEYKHIINKIQKWINNESELIYGYEDILRCCVVLGRLESIFRSKRYINPFGEIEEHIINELTLLFKVFINSDFLGKVITKESMVEYNPTFGLYSNICGGADADIIVDCCKIIDFKTTKDKNFKKKDAMQLVGYNLLRNSDVGYTAINELIIYKPRFDEIEFTNRTLNEILS